MSNKALLLSAIFFLNYIFLTGQTVHYDYDDSGNRVKRYIVLNKGNSSSDVKSPYVDDLNTSKKEIANNKGEEFEEKLGELTVRIFPNPTKGHLSVVISGIGQEETVDYQIFSQAGRIVDTKSRNGNEFTVNMEKYANGMYILRLMIKGKISTWKILKE